MALRDAQFTAQVAANGKATVTVQTKTRMQNWTVQQVSMEMPTAPLGSTCNLRKNGYLVTPLIATGDTAAGDPPVILRGASDKMTVEWAGCVAGAIGSVLVIYDDGTQ